MQINEPNGPRLPVRKLSKNQGTGRRPHGVTGRCLHGDCDRILPQIKEEADDEIDGDFPVRLYTYIS